MSITIKEWLEGVGSDACTEARKWLRSLGPTATMQEAWEKCQRSDWMFWAAGSGRSSVDDQDPRWRLAGCAIVRRTTVGNGTLWDLLTDPRSRNAVEVAENFANGTTTREELDAASAAARDAASAATWAAARDAASAAASAAAWAATWAAADDAADDAARSAAWAAADDAADDAARSAARAEHANILREYIANPWGE